jgi:hypothetical protein
VSCSLHDAVELEGRGVPTVVLCTEVFMDSAAEHATAYGLPEARVVAVQHPLAAIAPQAVVERADAVVERIVAQLYAPSQVS